ncbi:hypothetical protein A2U01_0096461, partial [Trifolium medium]|nr:hypothetical protein [Trifolium medium]
HNPSILNNFDYRIYFRNSLGDITSFGRTFSITSLLVLFRSNKPKQ